MPAPDLLDRPALSLFPENGGDLRELDLGRLVKTLEVQLGCDTTVAYNRFRDAAYSEGRESDISVRMVLEQIPDCEVEQTPPLVRHLEQRGELEQRTLEAAAPLAVNEAVHRGEVPGLPQGLTEHAYLGKNANRGRMLTSAEELENRLHRARQHDPGGMFAGEEGREKFRTADRLSTEVGLDLARSYERRSELAAAHAKRAEVARQLDRPLESVKRGRAKKRELEERVKLLDQAIGDVEKQRVEEKRAGRSDALLKQRVGVQLQEREEARKQLDQINPRTLSLETITCTTEQPVEGEKKLQLDSERGRVVTLEQRQATRKLQAEINAARAYRRAHPEVGLVQSLQMAEQGRIALDRAEG